MFLYRNSELQEDMNKLKEIASKTEHQKTIEPYEDEISELRKEIDVKNRTIENLYGLLREIGTDIDRKNMEYVTMVNQPMIQEYDPECAMEFEFKEAKVVRIPISKIVAEKINKTMWEYLNGKEVISGDK